MSTTPIPDRVAQLDQLTLHHGAHNDWDDGHCAMEVVAWLAGEGITDAPACASPVLARFVTDVNDSWGDEDRQRLRPYLPRMVGTGGDGQDEARSYLALEGVVRTYAPAWLDLAGLTTEAASLRDLRRIADQAAAGEVGPVVRAARDAATAAAWDADRAAAGAAWNAAGAAAWAAARDAAWNAARAAAGDAWNAAGAAAGAAARAAARAAVQPTVESLSLQGSALDLLDRMIDPAAVTP